MFRRSPEDTRNEQGKGGKAFASGVAIVLILLAAGVHFSEHDKANSQPGVAAAAPAEIPTTTLAPAPTTEAPTTVAATTVATAPPTTRRAPATTVRPAVTAPPATAPSATNTDFPIPGRDGYGGYRTMVVDNAGRDVKVFDSKTGTARLEVYPSEQASENGSAPIGVYGVACVMHDGVKTLEVIKQGGGVRFDSPKDDPAIGDICATILPLGSPSTLKPLDQLATVPLP